MSQKYGNFEVFSQDNFIVHKPIISEECLSSMSVKKNKSSVAFAVLRHCLHDKTCQTI